MAGTVFVINGVSSSGKTSLSKELQKVLLAKQQGLFLHVPIDLIWNMFPKDFEVGSVNYPDMIDLYLSHVQNLNKNYDLILDVVFKPSAIEKMMKTLDQSALHKVLVTANLETLQKREASREDRKAGQARSQMNDIYKSDTIYDYTADTNQKDPTQLAHEICDYFFLK